MESLGIIHFHCQSSASCHLFVAIRFFIESYAWASFENLTTFLIVSYVNAESKKEFSLSQTFYSVWVELPFVCQKFSIILQ